jgi:hypothetical protein
MNDVFIGADSYDWLTKANYISLLGWKHTKPPKNCSHKYIFFAIKIFGNVWTSNLGLFLLVLSIFD